MSDPLPIKVTWNGSRIQGWYYNGPVEDSNTELFNAKRLAAELNNSLRRLMLERNAEPGRYCLFVNWNPQQKIWVINPEPQPMENSSSPA